MQFCLTRIVASELLEGEKTALEVRSSPSSSIDKSISLWRNPRAFPWKKSANSGNLFMSNILYSGLNRL